MCTGEDREAWEAFEQLKRVIKPTYLVFVSAMSSLYLVFVS